MSQTHTQWEPVTTETEVSQAPIFAFIRRLTKSTSSIQTYEVTDDPDRDTWREDSYIFNLFLDHFIVLKKI